MKISYNWLQEFIDLDLSPEELADKLTLIGLEVEEIEEFGSTLEGVIVGEVLETKPHPNADRLKVCTVDLGDEKVQIVCGADNVAEGQKVPVATVGSTLPIKLDDGSFLTLKKAKLRGEESHGMICAEDELGLGTDHDGIMVLDPSLETGTPISDIFDLYQDTIIEIAITPNRPDATCHLGVARDIAAALDLELVKPAVKVPESSNTSDYSIEIESDKCHRYVGKLVKNVTIEDSPKWLQDKLTAIGLRPVNNVVDITNYVMYELGQPLHAFDFDNLNDGKIIVKEFDKEIEFETLDHIKRKCEAGTLFICDGNGPVAIAGVMGGLHSEVSDSTTNILIESAYFDPGSIRKTSKQQTLQTDASYRFERGIDPNLQAIAAQRTADLIIEVCGGEAEAGITDIHPVKTETHQLTLRKSYVNRLLGTDLSVEEIIQIVNGLELDVVSKNEDTITFEIPTFRPDLKREVDLIEEVGRLFDYNKIGSKNQGIFVSTEPLTDWELLLSKTRDVGVHLGFKEIYSNSLISQKEALNFVTEEQMIETLNPLNKDMSTMRPSLMHGFLKSASYNFNRKAETIRFFEVGNVFVQSEDATYHDGINEQTHLLFGLSGFKNTEHWTGKATPFSIFDLKSEVNAFFTKLGLAGNIKIKATDESSLTYSFKKIELGKVSTVSQTLLDVYDIEHQTYIAEFSLDKISEALTKNKAKSFTAIPKFPAFEFDFAVIVEQEISAGDLMNSIKTNAGNTLKNIDIFDVFEGKSIGEGNKSIAFRLNFIDPNKTLNIKEVEPIIQRVVKSLEKQFSAKLRS
ncbi:MAG: phenylalanine--tRNA ligase subunit beta [Balneola sp.]|nr:phenylalanine--tRNA ligase subunit beta [Balneola sp.]MBO6651867.1 phenylalanine--tRNA ligase subunit beta [Balneola sp.]MBO6710414.1 phenylalanine--tRNA ligase subunit beta [Balneola sp.]MBO6799099.1 phenylalanine--tRNA ligase subunit beta [Balneola sp.]MBO6870939.1 phenylalanine--tRNA ligase subunit beta [Balneola sp.]